MDVTTTRQRNLAHLVALLEGSTPARRQKDIAIDLDLSASYLSQLLAGKKMGDDVARKIEATRNLPHGWMDQPQWPAGTRVGEPESTSYSASHAMGITPQILAASHHLVRRACEILGVPFDPETDSDASLLLLGCSYLSARREHAVTVDNVVDFVKLLRKRNEEVTGNERSKGTRSAGTGVG